MGMTMASGGGAADADVDQVGCYVSDCDEHYQALVATMMMVTRTSGGASLEGEGERALSNKRTIKAVCLGRRGPQVVPAPLLWTLGELA
jgi:hypothetical protein